MWGRGKKGQQGRGRVTPPGHTTALADLIVFFSIFSLLICKDPLDKHKRTPCDHELQFWVETMGWIRQEVPRISTHTFFPKPSSPRSGSVEENWFVVGHRSLCLSHTSSHFPQEVRSFSESWLETAALHARGGFSHETDNTEMFGSENAKICSKKIEKLERPSSVLSFI